jgi:hypothetical protein
VQAINDPVFANLCVPVRRTMMGALLLLICLMLNSQVHPLYKVQKNAGISEGYYFLSVHKPSATVTGNNNFPYYNMILDHHGDAVYCKKFPGAHKICDFRIQPGNKMSYFQKDRFYFMDPSFNVIDSVSCLKGYQTDNHELLVFEDNRKCLLCVETVTMDLQSFKLFNHLKSAGSRTTQVQSGIIQEISGDSVVLFEWKAAEHYKFEEVDTFYISDPTKVDWTHFNSLDRDKDGNYLVSLRNFNELTKISRKDGSIIWRMGGNRNEFKFTNDPSAFVGQHDARFRTNSIITMFDNGREDSKLHPAGGKEYHIDERKKIATLTWKHIEDIYAHSIKGLGNVMRLANGNTLVNFGTSSDNNLLFAVMDKKGKKIISVNFTDTLRSYRVYNYFKIPFRIPRPVIKSYVKNGKTWLEASEGYETYWWNTGERSRRIEASGNGKHYVWVPAGKGGWVSSNRIVVGDNPNE